MTDAAQWKATVDALDGRWQVNIEDSLGNRYSVGSAYGYREDAQALADRLAAETEQPNDGAGAELRMLEKAYEHGWNEAAEWADRDDLWSDVGSGAYKQARDKLLSELKPAQPPPTSARGVTDDFLRHCARVMRGVIAFCEPKPRKAYDDPTEHCGGQALAELESCATDLEAAEQHRAASGSGAEPVAWRCFHCDEVFTDEQTARDHFGPHQLDQAACQIPIAEYRRMNETVRRYNAEDTALHREIFRLRASIPELTKRAEEEGYARGLTDSRIETTPPHRNRSPHDHERR